MRFGIVVDGTTRESMGLLGAEALFLASIDEFSLSMSKFSTFPVKKL